jgi:hypothetical protein
VEQIVGSLERVGFGLSAVMINGLMVSVAATSAVVAAGVVVDRVSWAQLTLETTASPTMMRDPNSGRDMVVLRGFLTSEPDQPVVVVGARRTSSTTARMASTTSAGL